jgi:hypothetical protein
MSIMQMVHEVLGEIDFDPASDTYFNITVQAKQWFSERSLEREWLPGSIYLNPPGGKVENKSQTGLFWQKLMNHRLECKEFTHAIFMAFSVEALQSTQGKGLPSIGEFPFCIPSKRIRFDGHVGKISPSHSNAIVYVPGNIDASEHFEEVFKELGVVVNV